MDQATFGGGCFWCLEAIFEQVQGVLSVASGFSGGDGPADYKSVCSGMTKHAEVVHLKFDPEVVGFETLTGLFFASHDPTTLNRQGNDIGPQYRSVIFAHGTEQADAARRVMDEIEREGVYSEALVTQIEPFAAFYEAGPEHRQYFQKNGDAPYCRAVIEPKVAKFRSRFKKYLKPEYV